MFIGGTYRKVGDIKAAAHSKAHPSVENCITGALCSVYRLLH